MFGNTPSFVRSRDKSRDLLDLTRDRSRDKSWAGRLVSRVNEIS